MGRICRSKTKTPSPSPNAGGLSSDSRRFHDSISTAQKYQSTPPHDNTRAASSRADPKPFLSPHFFLAFHAAPAAAFRHGRSEALPVGIRRTTGRLGPPPLQPVSGPQHPLQAALRSAHLPGVPLPRGGHRAAPLLGREPHLLHRHRVPLRRRRGRRARPPRRRPRGRARGDRQDPRQPRPQLLRQLRPPRRQHARGHRSHVRGDRERHGRLPRPGRLDQQRHRGARHRRPLPRSQRPAVGRRRGGRRGHPRRRCYGVQAARQEIRPCPLNNG